MKSSLSCCVPGAISSESRCEGASSGEVPRDGKVAVSIGVGLARDDDLAPAPERDGVRLLGAAKLGEDQAVNAKPAIHRSVGPVAQQGKVARPCGVRRSRGLDDLAAR